MNWEKLKGMIVFIKTENNITDIITGIFMLAMLAVFPLYFHNDYLDLVDVKYRFYYINVFATAILVLLVHLIFKLRGSNMPKYRKQLLGTDRAMLLFWMVFLISTLLSDYKYEAFWGNEGTWVGLFLVTVFFISYLCITRNLKFRKWYLEVFLVSGMLVCLLGIAHFFYLDPLHMKVYLNEIQKKHFVSTFGNINQYTAYVALFMAVSATLFATSETWMSRIWHYICMVVSFIAIILGISDNGYLSTFALLSLLPLYLFLRKDWSRRYAMILATYATVMAVLGLFLSCYQGRMMSLTSLFTPLAASGMLGYVAMSLWLITSLWYLWDYRKKDSKHKNGNAQSPVLRYVWSGILIIFAMIFTGVLIDINIGGNAGRYGALGNYLLLTDSWGNNRGWAWKTGLKIFSQFQWKDKLFGYGPETFYVLMVTRFWEEMTSVTGLKFMCAHNQFIQYLVTTGILGLLSYLGLMVTLIRQMVKRSSKNKVWVMPIVFALVCYNVQNFVNFDSMLVTPVFWTLIYLGLTGSSIEEVMEKEP